jgi:hypothetical protein
MWRGGEPSPSCPCFLILCASLFPRCALQARELYKRAVHQARYDASYALAPALALVSLSVDAALRPLFGGDASVRALEALQLLLRLHPVQLHHQRQLAGPQQLAGAMAAAAGEREGGVIGVGRAVRWLSERVQVERWMAEAVRELFGKPEASENVLMAAMIGCLGVVLWVRQQRMQAAAAAAATARARATAAGQGEAAAAAAQRRVAAGPVVGREAMEGAGAGSEARGRPEAAPPDPAPEGGSIRAQ